jgi:aminopeptidase N
MNQHITHYLKDYTPTNYLVDTIDLTFTINDTNVIVTNTSKYYKRDDVKNNLVLNGHAKLDKIELDDRELTSVDYELKGDQLILTNLPDEFSLTITTTIDPWQNKSCMGLYASRDSLMTQCEPQGFRKITYYQDRPDLMAIFTTTIIANKDKYPVLLSNGNKIKDETNDTLKSVTWHDPFKKPCYLFALVAGEFHILRDSYTTKSGRPIKLEIYTDDSDLNRSVHAIESLKRSMHWDETRFNLEYDLDCYMIVATNDFNMGAMENKGLNIFNTKYVLADKNTATDTDFIYIEAVIGHEYFHNWTGNRVTCRDWFQLSLKEGLTVFRDHEFTADMHNRGVKRISEVKRLRQFQFPEDASGIAHSVRPESYIEINNFYTVTIYEKGQEVVRMYQSILGTKGFAKGLALYLHDNDGHAATCEDFCNAMSHANNFDLSQFMLWYSQAGTPQLSVRSIYNSQAKQYTIEFTQTIPDTPGQNNKQPMLIPIKFGLLDRQGNELPNLKPSSGKYVRHEEGLVLLVTDKVNQFVFDNIASQPIPSILRDFSAPVKLEQQYTEQESLVLAQHDSDEFNRFEALSGIFRLKIKKIYVNLINRHTPPKLNDEFYAALRKILENDNLNPEFRALCFQLPSYGEMLTEIENVNPQLLYLAINYLATEIGDALFDSWMELYNINLTTVYDFNDHNKRSLKNTALAYLLKSLACKLDNQHSLQLIETLVLGQYYNADNMTDTIGSISAINDIDINVRDEVLKDFYTKWNTHELVIDKWFAVQALSNTITIDKLNSLMVDKAFIATNPNKIYALLRSFTINGARFHTAAGYEFIADKVIMIDKFNPQVASTLVHGFSDASHLNNECKQLARLTLKNILTQDKLSSDVNELASKILAGL